MGFGLGKLFGGPVTAIKKRYIAGALAGVVAVALQFFDLPVDQEIVQMVSDNLAEIVIAVMAVAGAVQGAKKVKAKRAAKAEKQGDGA